MFEQKTNKIETGYEVSERDEKMLQTIDAINAIFKKHDIENWAVGGFAVEGYKGQITRNHHDIDLITWEKDKKEIEKALKENNFEIQKGWNDNDGVYHEFKHKIIAKIKDIDTDIAFLQQDEETKEVFPSAFPEYHFPYEFLKGKEVSLNFGKGEKSTYNVPSTELLFSLLAQSERSSNKDDIDFLKKQINNPEKIEEIKTKYSLNYKKFHDAAWNDKK